MTDNEKPKLTNEQVLDMVLKSYKFLRKEVEELKKVVVLPASSFLPEQKENLPNYIFWSGEVIMGLPNPENIEAFRKKLEHLMLEHSILQVTASMLYKGREKINK